MYLSVIRLLFVATLVSSLALPGNLTVEEVSHPQCPFNAEASIAEDGSYLDIVYSTKGTTPNSLAAFGSGVSATNSKRKCYVAVSIRHNDQDTARLRTAGVEVTGNVKLDEGLVAKIETSLVMGASALSLVRHPNRCFFDHAHTGVDDSSDELHHGQYIRSQKRRLHAQSKSYLSGATRRLQQP